MSIEKMEGKMEPIKKMKETLVEWCHAELSKGKECVDTKEMGEVVDMIKDLAKAEKSCYESKYYESIVKAMEEAEEEQEMRAKLGLDHPDMMGYNSHRSARTGRYTSGGRMGFPMHMLNEPYIDEYINGHHGDFKMGYPGEHRGRMETGYPMMEGNEDMRHGEAYRNYRRARRNYTRGDASAKDEMREHASEHVADTLVTVREIWETADPDLRKKMKADFQKLVGDMNV